jgi:hypothetical protein
VVDRQKSMGLRGNAGWLLLATVLGMSVLLVYSIGQSEPFISPLSVGVMVGIAALVLGGLLGFLFGIPRYLQGSQQASSETSTGGGYPNRVVPYRDNTNLEEISDWLTKILIGVGLIEISQAGGSAGRLVTYIGDGMGGAPSSRIVAGATLIYFSALGFLGGYLLTRMALTSALARAAREAQEAYERMGTQKSGIRQQAEVTTSVAGLEDVALLPVLSDVVLRRLGHFENLAMGMLADALCETHTLKPRVVIGGESVDCVLEGIQSEKDYLFEVKYYIDSLVLNQIHEAVQELGRAVATARTAQLEAVGLLLIVLGDRPDEATDHSTERTTIDQLARQLSEIGQDSSAHVRVAILTEDELERMRPQELRLRLLDYPDVVTSLERLAADLR